MTPLPANRILTANGEYQILDENARVPTGIYAGKMCLLEVDGDFGGGTVTLGYEGESGSFVPYRDEAGAEITTLVAYGRQVACPRSGVVCVKLLGATAPAILVSLIPVKL